MLQGNWFDSYKTELKYITYVASLGCTIHANHPSCLSLERVAPDICIAVIDPSFDASHPNGAVPSVRLLGATLTILTGV